MMVALLIVPTNFTYAVDNGRALTSDEQAAFIVRDEWTEWVNNFTASLSELDKNATAKIYDDMDFYDMQYRFTEKYKKVPEYLTEEGKPQQKLLDMIKEKRKEIAARNSGQSVTKDFLMFTALEDNSKVGYGTMSGSVTGIDVGYSLDGGKTWSPWTGTTITLAKAGDTICVWNKANTLNSVTNYITFDMTAGSFDASGDVTSMINFTPLKAGCFAYLFSGCGNRLKSAPRFPSTTLAVSCYYRTFQNCTGLTVAPELPSKTLYAGCYYEMFKNCSNLSYIKIGYTGALNNSSFENWVSGVANSGIIAYNGTYTDASFGASGLPKNSTNKWTVINDGKDHLKFTAYTDSEVYYTLAGGLTANMYYAKDGVWHAWSAGSSNKVQLSTGESMKVYNMNNKLSSSLSKYCNFHMTGVIAASGNCNSMQNFVESHESYTFVKLFYNCESLVTAPELPGSANSVYCYNQMFSGCANLEVAPYLPSTSVADNAYTAMFSGCSSLREIKIGYTGLFNGDQGFVVYGFTGWVSGVGPNGVFYYNGESTKVGDDARPSGWELRSFTP